MTTVPVCPNCHHAAHEITFSQTKLIYDLICRKCGMWILTRDEFDRLVWVDRSEIDWHPPPEDNR